MKLLRYQSPDGIFCGEERQGDIFRISGDIFGEFQVTGIRERREDVTLLAPVAPPKIVCVGKNYADHATELGGQIPKNPIIFLKPDTAIQKPGGAIVYPTGVTRLDFEAELAFVVGKTAKNIKAAQAADYIFGYTCFNDVTARDIQKSDGQWTRAKGHDTFAPFGPVLDTDFDYRNKTVRSVLNGNIMQDGNTSEMMWCPEELLEFISGFMTLLPGDVVATGTPAGIGPMNRGDTIEIVVEGLAALKNTVI